MIRRITGFTTIYLEWTLLQFVASNVKGNECEFIELRKNHFPDAFSLTSCESKPDFLEPQDGFFTLKGRDNSINLTLNNADIPEESVLYTGDMKHLRGNITLKYFGKLKIVSKTDLYLDGVSFLNTSVVQVIAGYEKNEGSTLTGASDVYILNIFAHHSSISVYCNSLKVLESAKVNISGTLALFKCKNFQVFENAFLNFHNAEIEFVNAVISGEVRWRDTLKLKSYSGANSFVGISKATLNGSRLFLNNVSNVIATKESIFEVAKCVSESKILNLYGDLKGLASCQISSDLIHVKSCSFSREKSSVMKTKSLEIEIEGDTCTENSFESHGIIYVTEDAVIRSSRQSKMLLGIGSFLKTGSLTLDAGFSDFECYGCRVTVNDQVINSIKLSELVVISEIELSYESKIVPKLTFWEKYDCYEPVFVSERCKVRYIESNGKNSLNTISYSYKKIGSVLIEGSVNMDVRTISIINSAFIVDGKLEFKNRVANLFLKADKSYREISLAPVSIEIATRTSGGYGRVLSGKYYKYVARENALNHFDLYDVALDFELITLSEHQKCKRGRSDKNVYCPIYVQENQIIRNTDGLQSIFHAKSYQGQSIDGLSLGNDVHHKGLEISDNIPDVHSLDVNNQWSGEVAKHKTLLEDTGSITSLAFFTNGLINYGDSKLAVLKQHRLSANLALNLDSLSGYEVYSRDTLAEILRKGIPGPLGDEFLWNILDYENSSRDLLRNDALIVKLFKCVGLQFPVVCLANQDLTGDLLNDLIFVTIGKLKGIPSAKLLEHLVDNTCAVHNKLRSLGATPGVPLDRTQKELFESPGVWPIWLDDCPGEHSKCVSLELALNEKSLDEMLPHGAKLSADESIVLENTRLQLGMGGSIVARESLIATLAGDTEIEGRLLANEIESHVDGNLKNVGIISGGKVACTAKNIINLGKIEASKGLAFRALGDFIAAGFIGSEGSLTVDVARKLTLLSLKEISVFDGGSFKEVRQHVSHVTSLIAKGGLDMSAGSDILNIGAEVIGQSVFISSSSEKIVTVPLEVYNEVLKAGEYFHQSYKGAKYVKASIKAAGKEEVGESPGKALIDANSTALIEKEIARIKSKSGSVIIRGRKEVRIQGSDVSGTDDVGLFSDEGSINVASIKAWKETVIITRGSDLFSQWEEKSHEYDDDELLTASVVSGGTLHSYSQKDQNWVGASVRVFSTRLVAGSPEHKASINLLPLFRTKVIEVETKSQGFKIELEKLRAGFVKKTAKKGCKSSDPLPTIIELEGDFLAYVNGNFTIIDPALIDRSEDERGNIHIKIKADEINFEAAPNFEASYSYVNEAGLGVGFSIEGRQFKIKGFRFKESSETESKRVSYKTPRPFRGWIELDANTIRDAGVIYFARALHTNAEIEIHGVVMNEANEAEVKELFESGVTFGIKSNLGAIADSRRGYGHYVEALKALTSAEGSVGNVWVKADGGKSRDSQPVPTIIDVDDLEIKSSQLQFLGTQVRAYRGYIEAKYLKGHAVPLKSKTSGRSDSVYVGIPITVDVPPNIRTALQRAAEKSELHLNANIYVSDRLTMKIAGKADLKGVSIDAGQLEASFNELVLESLQNSVESGSLEWSLDEKKASETIRDRDRHVVGSLTALLGRESARVVVAEALRLNGALIANADRDERGVLTDHGNLTLKVGELFVQHLYDYDRGTTLGAALGIGDGKGGILVDAMPTFGSFERDGFTRSTVGKGDVVIGGGKLEGLNRDVSKAQEFATRYNIEPITARIKSIGADVQGVEIIKYRDFDIEEMEHKMDFVRDKMEYLFRAFAFLSGEETEQDYPHSQATRNSEEGLNAESPEDYPDSQASRNSEELRAKEHHVDKNVEAKILFSEIAADLKERYGVGKAGLMIEEGRERLVKRLKSLQNIEEGQYTVDGDDLIVRLPNVGIVPASYAAERGLDVTFDIVDPKVGTHRVGKHSVRISPKSAATMLLYEVGSYLVESGADISVGEVVRFAKSLVGKAVDSVKQAVEKMWGTGTADPGPDDFEPQQRKKNPPKPESKIWKELRPYKGKTKTNGLKGKKQRFYQWDNTHNDIEVYDSNGQHLGSIDPNGGEHLKGPVKGRTIKK